MMWRGLNGVESSATEDTEITEEIRAPARRLGALQEPRETRSPKKPRIDRASQRSDTTAAAVSVTSVSSVAKIRYGTWKFACVIRSMPQSR